MPASQSSRLRARLLAPHPDRGPNSLIRIPSPLSCHTEEPEVGACIRSQMAVCDCKHFIYGTLTGKLKIAGLYTCVFTGYGSERININTPHS